MTRTDHPTSPIAPAVTDQHLRWPTVNDDEPLPTADSVAADAATPTPSTPPPVECAPVEVAAPTPNTGSFWLSPRARQNDSPLPAVGDYWDLGRPDPVPYTPLQPVLPPMRRTAPVAQAAMISGLASVPLIPLAGLGGVVGALAAVLGLVGALQIGRRSDYRGTGRAITGIVLGTGSAIVGLPILFLVLLIAGL
ncbi:DUF4190 domain-containing protein [Gordonia sp. NPDC003376]